VRANTRRVPKGWGRGKGGTGRRPKTAFGKISGWRRQASEGGGRKKKKTYSIDQCSKGNGELNAYEKNPIRQGVGRVQTFKNKKGRRKSNSRMRVN